MDFDVVIIGAGVVGLACAYEFSRKNKVLLVERHHAFGQETSSRNSEVIHAGIYYTPGSLKARLCVRGNRMIYDWCENRGVEYRRIGKYIVAVDEAEIDDLEAIYARARENGVKEIRRADLHKLRRDEPNVRAAAALWSPYTGIVDSHGLMRSIESAAIGHGCDVVYNHRVEAIDRAGDMYKIGISDDSGEYFEIAARCVVNSAGLDADRIAEIAGIDVEGAEYRLHYCRGHYFRISAAKSGLANHLIYPVPAKNMPGLGIHVTVDIAGQLRLGPDTQYLDGRKRDYVIADALGDKFYIAAARYLEGLNREDIMPDLAGIRPKLQPPGGEPRDFVIRNEADRDLPNFINLIGIESPGLTCCFAIAEYASGLIHK